ncbi:MAG: type III pantothenate kinase [Clostridia bacterium]|nr:type III pantothenate kinase [Clostridia bacterium]
MLMAVNVGNSRISVGVFQNDACELLFRFQISTDVNKTSDEYAGILRMIARERGYDPMDTEGCILSCVVPQLTHTVSEALCQLTSMTPMVVGPGVKTGFSLKIDSPSELGGDMVANAAAVLQNQKEKGSARGGSVIVDMGTVTTISVLNRAGEYIGCSILPGIRMSFDSMHGATAQLPNVAFSAPKKLIGRNTQESVRSGVIFGNAIMLDGFVRQIARELRCQAEDLNLTMTGEYAPTVLEVCRSRFEYDENLTLKGLFYICRNNTTHE